MLLLETTVVIVVVGLIVTDHTLVVFNKFYSQADLPTYLKIFCPNFFWKKYGSEIPYLPMIWTYVKIFVSFFYLSPNGKDVLGGDTAHTLLTEGAIGVGTPHNIERNTHKTPNRLPVKFEICWVFPSGKRVRWSLAG